MTDTNNTPLMERVTGIWSRFLKKTGLIRKETRDIRTKLEAEREETELERIQTLIQKH